MRSWKSAATVAVLTATALLFLGCENLPFAGSPYGDNTTRANAFEIELGTEYGARIRENDSVQWFKFTTAHSDVTWDEVLVSITVPDDDLRVRMQLYDVDGNRLDTWGRTTAGADMDVTVRRVGGTYFLRFSGQSQFELDLGSSGKFNFTVTNQNANDSYGPNHTIDDAYTIVADATYNGVLVNNDEADYYHFAPTVDSTQNYLLTILDVETGLLIRRTFYRQDKSHFETRTQTSGGVPPAIILENAGSGFFLRISGASQFDIDHGSRGAYSFILEPTDLEP